MNTKEEKLEKLNNYLKRIYTSGYSHFETQCLCEFEYLMMRLFADGKLSIDELINSIINYVNCELRITIRF